MDPGESRKQSDEDDRMLSSPEQPLELGTPSMDSGESRKQSDEEDIILSSPEQPLALGTPSMDSGESRKQSDEEDRISSSPEQPVTLETPTMDSGASSKQSDEEDRTLSRPEQPLILWTPSRDVEASSESLSHLVQAVLSENIGEEFEVSDDMLNMIETQNYPSSFESIGDYDLGDQNKSDKEQTHDAGPSCEVSSPRKRRLSDAPERNVKILEERRQFGKDEYVYGKWKDDRLVELRSCEFTYPHNNRTVHIRKLSLDYLFIVDEENFIARVIFDKIEELDFVELSVDIKRDFFKKLIIAEIIRDNLISDRNAAYKKFKKILQIRGGKTIDNLKYAEDIFQLSRILESYKNSSKGTILDNIVVNTYISFDFKNACQQLLNREEALHVRRKDFPQYDEFDSKNVFGKLFRTYTETVKKHKTSLLERCSSFTSPLASSLNSNINALSGEQVFYIRNKDIDLFSDLAKQTDELFLKFFNNLQGVLFSKVMNAKNHKSLKELAPLTHPIYFNLCKHFQEIILEISGKTHICVKNLLNINEQERMNLVKTINWPSASPLNYFLEQQYRFIFKLIQHFEPRYNSNIYKKEKFKYEFKLSKSSVKPYWQRVQGWFPSSNKSSDMPDERLVWIYFLDNAVDHLFSKEPEKCLELFMPLLEGYTGFIQETEDVDYESFKIVMHNTIRFITQTIPYLSYSEVAPEIDETILTYQIESIKNAISREQFIDFRDLLDVYNKYWKHREDLIEKIPDKFPHGKFKQDMEGIRQKLLNIVNTVLIKKVMPQVLIKYFRLYNEFLEYLSSVEFSWFIKDASDSPAEEVELVNKDKKSYKVLDPESFIKKNENIPGHYLIEIIDDLLNILSNLLGRKEWSDYDNLNAASELVSAIQKSFLYLTEQPNYLSFDIYKEERIKPFASVVENNSSYEDFMNCVDLIGKCFEHLRKPDEIDIKKALTLYRKENCNVTIEAEVTLIHCYCRYLEKFNSYIQRTCGKYYLDRIDTITKEVKEQLELINIKEWEEKFKKDTIPELLAGVAAVWSIQQSKDNGHVGKCVKPHCTQVLCILVLLSVDKDNKGVEKHFAQVLTGQGKSLVLALLSSLLALTGHQIRTICYNDYLANRDQEDFNNLFMVLGIRDKIHYGTSMAMAEEVLQPLINGERKGLRDLIQNLIYNHSTEQLEYLDMSNYILLIDEIDVLFSNQFYGHSYYPSARVNFPALLGIQEKIWEMTCKDYEKDDILTKVHEFIRNQTVEQNQDFIQFNEFLLNPGRYHLLKQENFGVVKKEYTNYSFYAEELDRMIDNAIHVAKVDTNDPEIRKYKINDGGVISYKVNSHYSPTASCQYFNVFYYFKLKIIDYDNKNYYNYGYMSIDGGSISYAQLPKKYSLILGVSSTLPTQTDHESEAVRNSYGIYENSIMPSYYGDFNLKFDKYYDFAYENSEKKWVNKIYNHANYWIRSKRSVLIFFDTVVEIDKFKDKFGDRFEILNTLTEITDIQTKQKYIDEAGIAKTLTLATKGMGRGVDFKSSVEVENTDGMHVIQTFFSHDIKEETQIKGRTARKNNRGSYELILCKPHLTKAKLIDKKDSTVSYESLSQTREKLLKEEFSEREDLLKIMEGDNQLTMRYFESFFRTE